MSKMIRVESCRGCYELGWWNRPHGGGYSTCFILRKKEHKREPIKITDTSKILPNCPLEDYKDGEPIEDKLDKIKTWCEAYPIKIFPEPDFEKAHKVLKENGMTLDAISASNMRHVLEGIKEIIEGDG